MEEFVVDNLTVTFDGLEKPVLHGASLALRPGRLMLVCGANGSGKTVLLRACLGLENAQSGGIRLDGTDVLRDPRRLYRRSATVFQNPETQIFGTTVEEEIAFSLDEQREPTARHRTILTDLGLEPLRPRPPAVLSGGQRQRLALAGALLSDAEILFLDEPTSALDYRYIRALVTVLRTALADGIAILATAHDVRDLWELADSVLLLHEGRTVYNGARAGAEPFFTPEFGMRPFVESAL